MAASSAHPDAVRNCYRPASGGDGCWLYVDIAPDAAIIRRLDYQKLDDYAVVYICR